MSSIRSVMVHLDGTPRGVVRLRLAQAIAQAQDAQLTGLFAVTSPILPMPYEYAASEVAVETLRKLHDEWRGAACTMFDQVTESRRERSVWVESDDALVAAGVARRALLADLVVLGQQQRDDPHAGRLPPGFVQSVLITSGCPALVVPYAGEFAKVGDTILVAWKATAESGRALKAALPLMQAARHVHVVAWGEERPTPQDRRLDIGGYLELHGVAATVHWEGEETHALGEMLLSRAADFGADLLVMGCYGHSRAREFVLGGVSRTVLGSMTVPVLMSH